MRFEIIFLQPKIRYEFEMDKTHTPSVLKYKSFDFLTHISKCFDCIGKIVIFEIFFFLNKYMINILIHKKKILKIMILAMRSKGLKSVC